MTKEQQLERERRLAIPAAASAFLAAIFALASLIYSSAAIKTISNSKTPTVADLQSVHNQSGAYTVEVILQALSTLLLIGILVFLYQAVRLRRPSIPTFALVLAIAAPVVLAVVSVIAQVHTHDVAQQFYGHPGATSGSAGETRAKNLLSHGAGNAYLWLTIISTLALAIAFIVISINAMRAGLFNTLLGSVGIVIGAGIVLLGLIAAIIQVFWLPAVALLALGRWPGARGPAWDSGEAIPWPKPPGRGGLFQRPPQAAPETPREPEPDAAAATVATQANGREPVTASSRSTRRRKRKRR